MRNTNTTASAGHKQAASEHLVCAEHHSKAADCHDKSKPDEVLPNGNQAIGNHLRVFGQVML